MLVVPTHEHARHQILGPGSVPVCLPVAPPGFCNRGEVRYGSIGGLEYEFSQKLTHLLQCVCRVIRSSSMTIKAHTYYIIFGRPPTGGKLPPWRRQCCLLLTCRTCVNGFIPTSLYLTLCSTSLQKQTTFRCVIFCALSAKRVGYSYTTWRRHSTYSFLTGSNAYIGY